MAGRRRCQSAGAESQRCSAMPREHDAARTRPAIPRARTAVQESDRPDLARAWHWCSARPECRTSSCGSLPCPTAQAARTSVIWAMAIIGGFYVLTLFLGMAAAINVGRALRSRHRSGRQHGRPLLAQALGGGPESMRRQPLHGLRLGRRIRHDRRRGRGPGAGCRLRDGPRPLRRRDRKASARPTGEVKAARIATVFVGAMAIVIGIPAKGQNVAHLVALAFAVARRPILRTSHALLEALQYRRHRGRHDHRNGGGDRPRDGVAEPHVSESGQGGRAESNRRRAGKDGTDHLRRSPPGTRRRSPRPRRTRPHSTRPSAQRRRTSRSSKTTTRASWGSRSRCSISAIPASSRFRLGSSR